MGTMVERIRKLTPKECWRLQGWGVKKNNEWDDSAFEKAKAAGISNSQLYKQAGNGCSANITEIIGRAIPQGTFIDFFSGAGGVRMGMERANQTCVGFCEYDKYARMSYCAIFGETDIEGTNEGRWVSHDIRNVIASKLPKADCWFYGFP